MPKKAKIYVALIAAAGIGALLAGLMKGSFSDLPRFFTYLVLAALASGMKVQLPGFTGTMSLSFLFILIGVANYSAAETVITASIAGLVQCLWKPRTPPRPVHVVFNVSTLAASTGAAFALSHWVLSAAAVQSLALLLVLGATLYFVINTAVVSGIISLIEGRRLKSVWLQCYFWTFPYYLAGAAMAALVTSTSRYVGWKLPMLILPLSYLIYTYYRIHVERAGSDRVRSATA